MKFILLGNYPPDKQESMKKYAVNLKDSLLKNNVDAEIWYPKVFFGSGWSSTISGMGKWFGYIDKWILFPLIIRLKLLFHSQYSRKDVYFHVCDHSNSPYLASLSAVRSGITCHDVLAIRGALGYADAYCPATSTGKILQKWILNNLKKAKILTAVSQLTMNQLLDLCGGSVPAGVKWNVIHNSFNADFYPMDTASSKKLIQAAGLPVDQEFIFHVGSSLPRKNRKMLLEMTHQLGERWNGLICFAGQPLNATLKLQIEELGLQKRVISVVKPEHETLVALYSACTAFIFPSYSEGFGWPLIEAQACGAPVVASDVDPMPEVSGGTALHANPDKADEFAAAFIQIADPDKRQELISAGYENAKRFDSVLLAKDFIMLYAK